MVPYTVDVVAMDHPGIVHEIADFFATRDINIEEMSTWTYPAAHTGAPMFSLNMTVSLPAGVHIGRLRDEFTGFCDNLNLDATIEPTRHSSEKPGNSDLYSRRLLFALLFARFSSITRTSGVQTISMASSILPPGMTMVFGRTCTNP